MSGASPRRAVALRTAPPRTAGTMTVRLLPSAVWVGVMADSDPRT